MFLLNSTGTDPYFNLALEEILLKKRNEEFIILGRNSRAVIAGKHQCIHREINSEFVNAHSIPVLRRITGGGTVYHDEGNLTFAFIRNCAEGKQIDFPRHLNPVIDFLGSLGVTAELSGSDIRVDGKKISGNAEHVYHNRVLHHGTILFDADLDYLRNCLRSDTSRYITRAVTSNPWPVSNLSKKITQFGSIAEFQVAMSDFFMKKNHAETFLISGKESLEASELAKSKYTTWDWTFAYGPEFELPGKFIFRGSECTFRLFVRHGVINNCIISGNEVVERAAPDFIGIRHMPGDISQVLGSLLIDDLDVYNFF